MLFVSGCAMYHEKIINTDSVFCAKTSTIRLTIDEIYNKMSSQSLRQIDNFNEIYRKECLQ